jgi:ammonia channel protein AmtB
MKQKVMNNFLWASALIAAVLVILWGLTAYDVVLGAGEGFFGSVTETLMTVSEFVYDNFMGVFCGFLVISSIFGYSISGATTRR